MNKTLKNIFKVLILLLLIVVIEINVKAYDLTHLFEEYYGVDTIASARTPQRDINGDDEFPPVISKLNQPRVSSGQNPHTGTDFYMDEDIDVYPLFAGYVTANVQDIVPDQSGYVQIKSTINGEDYYYTYYHIRPDLTLTVYTYVNLTRSLGEVQIDCNVGISPTHVHIACRKDASNGLITKLYPFFRNSYAYNFGSDMDYMSGDHFDGNMFYIYAYTKTDKGTNDPYGYVFDCSKIVMYYNLNSNGWTNRTYNVNNLYSSTTKLYQFNLLDTGMKCGDTIKFYLAAERNGSDADDDICFNVDNSSYLDYAIWPMYYKQPEEVRYDVYYEYILGQSHEWSSWSVTTLSTCTTNGEESRVCNLCGAIETRSLSPLGHSLSNWTVEAASTCYTKGTEKRECTRCGYYETNQLPINPFNHVGGGHWEVATNPTCTVSGSERQICNGCGAVLGTKPIPSLGHSMSAWSELTPSTCCTPGTQIRHCTRSGCSHSESGSLPLNPNNHAGGSYWSVVTPPTCTTSGKSRQICYGCSAVLSTTTVPALGHNWSGWVYQYTYYDEDWQSNVHVFKRTCSRCGVVEYDYI